MLLIQRRQSFDRICPWLGIGIGTGTGMHSLIAIVIAIVHLSLHRANANSSYYMIPSTKDNHFPNPVSPAGHDLKHSYLLIMYGVPPLAIGVEDC